ncbi:carboxylesterase family protein [Emcibacter sp. SYSU 3D8]|uniref:carboxylesterase/lipase family protein n=1 Tax=Emcibacter sp. SYSU 3D8 TaxID=3133969 RepID=UPI0031FEFE5F
MSWTRAAALSVMIGALALGLPGAAATEATLVVHTASGPVRGALQDGMAAFKGIPFAAPPVGTLRWRPPQPITPWTGVRDATEFGAMCAQPTLPSGPARGSEDCLSINVWTPDGKTVGKRPVMVWIYGGAFVVGSSAQLLDQGATELSKRGVVLVSFNYRVGRFGFFAHPDMAKAHPGEPGANYWLMDQIAALKWVKANISAFGGDPDNVTIFGVSAGGTSVNALVASPAARGLFHKAISQSGGGLFNSSMPLAQARRAGMAIAARAGVAGPGSLDRLRAMSTAQILANEQGPPEFLPVVDGMLLTDTLPAMFAKGHIAPVPFLAGTNSNEFSVFGLMGFTGETLGKRFGVNIETAKPVYNEQGALSDNQLVSQIGTDFIFTAGSMGLASMAAKAGNPAYTYRLAYIADEFRPALKGVPHAGDQMYVFGLDYKPEVIFSPGTSASSPSDKDRRISAMMADYWTNFARTGDPNGKGLPVWGMFKPPAPMTLVIDDETASVPDFRKAQLSLWYRMWERQSGLTVE